LFVGWSEGFETASAFKLFDFTDILLFAVALVGIAGALGHGLGLFTLPFPSARAATIAGIVATSIVFAFLVEFDSRKIGIWLALIGSIGLVVGGVLAERVPAGGLAALVGGGAPTGVGAGQPGAGAPGAGAAGPYGGTGTPPPAQPTAPPTQPQPPAGGGAAGAGAAGAGQPAGWYADPKGEKRLRYWDGAAWTDRTAD
jgi:hypothetical protein